MGPLATSLFVLASIGAIAVVTGCCGRDPAAGPLHEANPATVSIPRPSEKAVLPDLVPPRSPPSLPPRGTAREPVREAPEDTPPGPPADNPPPPLQSELVRDIRSANRIYKTPSKHLRYDQSVITLEPSVPAYYIAYNMVTPNLADSGCVFTLLIDIITAKDRTEANSMIADGASNTFRSFCPRQRSRIAPLLPLKNDVNYLIEHSLDFSRGTWRTRIGGIEVFSRSIKGTGAEQLRFSAGNRDRGERDPSIPITMTLSNLSVVPNQLGPSLKSSAED